jgi:hypothetical protein
VISLVAITDAADALPAPPLRAVRVGSLCALCEPASEESVTLDALVSREALIDGLMEDHDRLPVRYGSDLADEAAAARVLTERHDELRAALDRVRGAVELSVRVLPVDEPADAVSGREYLAARTERAGVARELHDTLSSLARGAVLRPGPELLRAAYLVERGAVHRFVAEVLRLQDAHPELALLCTGPWAPFSFASEEAVS